MSALTCALPVSCFNRIMSSIDARTALVEPKSRDTALSRTASISMDCCILWARKPHTAPPFRLHAEAFDKGGIATKDIAILVRAH